VIPQLCADVGGMARGESYAWGTLCVWQNLEGKEMGSYASLRNGQGDEGVMWAGARCAVWPGMSVVRKVRVRGSPLGARCEGQEGDVACTEIEGREDATHSIRKSSAQSRIQTHAQPAGRMCRGSHCDRAIP